MRNRKKKKKPQQTVRKLAHAKAECPECSNSLRIPLTPARQEGHCDECGAGIVSKVIALVDVNGDRLDYVHGQISALVPVISSKYDIGQRTPEYLEQLQKQDADS